MNVRLSYELGSGEEEVEVRVESDWSIRCAEGEKLPAREKNLKSSNKRLEKWGDLISSRK